jgi:outer membrane lipoprotein carrier protein
MSKQGTHAMRRWRTACILALFFLRIPAAPEPAFAGPQEPNPTREQPAHGTPAGKTGDKELDQLLLRMETVYQKLDSFQAEFVQGSETKSLKRKKESFGEIFFRKPDRMRWSYRAPEKREIYINGKQMDIYMPQQNTLIKQSLGEALTDTAAPAKLFMGPAALGETFQISRATPGKEEGGLVCLRLIPWKRGGMSVEEVFLWLGQEDLLPRKTVSTDILGNVTTLTFSDGKANTKLQDEIFRFVPPPDVQVQEDVY